VTDVNVNVTNDAITVKSVTQTFHLRPSLRGIKSMNMQAPNCTFHVKWCKFIRHTISIII